MRYFLDTEFIEDGNTIDLISLALVGNDGSELYLCNRDCDLSRACSWVEENVLPQLPPLDSKRWVPKEEIAARVAAMLRFDRAPELWAYHAAYDWVALCQLFGRMVDLPPFMPRYCLDLKQWAALLGSPELPRQTGRAHDALQDARWNQIVHAHLRYLSEVLSSERAERDGLKDWLVQSGAAEVFRLGEPELRWSLERMFSEEPAPRTRAEWQTLARSYAETTRYVLDRPDRYPQAAEELLRSSQGIEQKGSG